VGGDASSIINRIVSEWAALPELTDAMRSAAVGNGDLGRPEAILTIQAHTLDTIFNELARRSQANVSGGYLEAAERYLRLALKAQSQCRTTLEALAEIKNPRPVAFVKQQNIAAGPQQVNNAPMASRAEEIENPQSKLLEHHEREEWLVPRAASAAGRSDSTLEPVEALHRPEDSQG